MNLMGYGSIAGTPAFMMVDPTTTNATYANAMVIAVRNSVNAHPSVYPVNLESGSAKAMILSPRASIKEL